VNILHFIIRQVPKWVRGNESAELLINNRVISLKILGLGTSIGTSGITAEAIVVRSFDELNSVKDKVGLGYFVNFDIFLLLVD